MKKLIVFYLLLVFFTSADALADASSDLQKRLNKIKSFHAIFKQKIIDGNGRFLQNGEGEIWVKRPNLFNWHMTAPDESILISDGKTLWFYNPYVEQVSATWLKDAVSETPFMLILRNQVDDWKKYNIAQKGNDFSLRPKSTDDNKQFTINVSPNGTINHFSAIEQDGQRTSYALQNQQNVSVSANKFNFTPPRSVTLDDQRQ